MRIFRGPSTTEFWQETDRQSVAHWQPGERLHFDGTIDKYGRRHTAIGVEVTEEDAVSMHAALLRYHKNRSTGFERECNHLRSSVEELENVLGKISSLISYNRNRAPDSGEMFEAIGEIVDHYRYGFKREKPFKSRFKWLRWKSL